ncbi:apolipoprotein N-acyltransferase [Kitasatospora aureofaciens]|uniref:Apolipoprotein N-acyltransferase n=1 Tax=Kitasatospora aureofaciens TaxID=1894 RepID=A0A1E7MX80_KITAU|nr:apolipoprotein N-acyltransferase [Kitasatospora aureofaciens]ARF81460.1 apolipoprotein N-acyltransferase [Kitasatospora aureofaciens]OEV33046.1 apolipoprotein N-acyltransferase [Kitasatospora aureofaciens]GGU55575.1 apolipoprotein N-acyltransferase [Kitasatospora aureofaciens]
MAIPVTQERSGTAPEPQDPAPKPGRGARALAKVRAGLPRTSLAALAGLLLALAFPPYDLWPLSLLGVAALSLLTRGRTFRQGAWTGFALGFPFFLMLLSWLRVVGWDATVGLSVVEALFLALLGGALALTSRLPGWPLWAAALWVTQEWARDRLPLGGFPWGRLAFANTATPYTPLAALGGAPLVTFAVALSGTLLAWAALRLRGPGRTPRTAALGGLGAVAALLAGYLVPVPTAADDTVKVAIVQGNVPNPGMDFLGRPMMVLNNHASATERLAADIQAGKRPRPDVVIWPENSSDLDPFSDPLARQRIDEAVQAVGVPTLVGTLVDGPDAQHVQNEGIVWDPVTGPGASYTKQHPVPFGEYVPFRAQLMKVITRLQRVARDFYPGDHNGVMQLGPAKIGDVICFEVAYDEIVRDTVDSGARVLVVQTNNATYARTGQPEQQLAMSRLRAVEHGRAVLIAATSGISAVIAPDGTVEQRTAELTPAELSATVPLRDGTTVADRVGALPEWTLAVGGLLACGAAVLVGRRRKVEAGTPAAGGALDRVVP